MCVFAWHIDAGTVRLRELDRASDFSKVSTSIMRYSVSTMVEYWTSYNKRKSRAGNRYSTSWRKRRIGQKRETGLRKKGGEVNTHVLHCLPATGTLY